MAMGRSGLEGSLGGPEGGGVAALAFGIGGFDGPLPVEIGPSRANPGKTLADLLVWHADCTRRPTGSFEGLSTPLIAR